MRISVIIPTLDESTQLAKTIEHLRAHEESGLLKEIIVSDGGSKDDSPGIAKRAGVILHHASKSRRSIQMNEGAALATGDVLYFLHADCLPPESYLSDIRGALESGFGYGCFRRKIASTKSDLSMISFISRFRGPMFRGGDASLFVWRDAFEKAGRFRDDLYIMEDFEIMPRLRKQGKFRLLPNYVLASDRKHKENKHSWKVHVASVLVFSMFYLGFSQSILLKTYRKLVVGARYQK